MQMVQGPMAHLTVEEIRVLLTRLASAEYPRKEMATLEPRLRAAAEVIVSRGHLSSVCAVLREVEKELVERLVEGKLRET